MIDIKLSYICLEPIIMRRFDAEMAGTMGKPPSLVVSGWGGGFDGWMGGICVRVAHRSRPDQNAGRYPLPGNEQDTKGELR